MNGIDNGNIEEVGAYANKSSEELTKLRGNLLSFESAANYFQESRIIGGFIDDVDNELQRREIEPEIKAFVDKFRSQLGGLIEISAIPKKFNDDFNYMQAIRNGYLFALKGEMVDFLKERPEYLAEVVNETATALGLNQIERWDLLDMVKEQIAEDGLENQIENTPVDGWDKQAFLDTLKPATLEVELSVRETDSNVGFKFKELTERGVDFLRNSANAEQLLFIYKNSVFDLKDSIKEILLSRKEILQEARNVRTAGLIREQYEGQMPYDIAGKIVELVGENYWLEDAPEHTDNDLAAEEVITLTEEQLITTGQVASINSENWFEKFELRRAFFRVLELWNEQRLKEGAPELIKDYHERTRGAYPRREWLEAASDTTLPSTIHYSSKIETKDYPILSRAITAIKSLRGVNDNRQEDIQDLLVDPREFAPEQIADAIRNSVRYSEVAGEDLYRVAHIMQEIKRYPFSSQAQSILASLTLVGDDTQSKLEAAK